MKFLLQLIFMLVTGYIAEMFFVWYSIAIVAFLCGFIFKSKANFLAGFFGIGLLWLIEILLIESTSSSDLATRVAQIFPLQERTYLIEFTIILGGLVGGFASLTGALLKHDQPVPGSR